MSDAPAQEFRKIPPAQAKAQFLELISQGRTHKDAARLVGRDVKAVEYWRQKDTDFAFAVDMIHQRKKGGVRVAPPDFPEFCEKYLRQPLHAHQLRWWDILNGREPRDLHHSMVYQKGENADTSFLLFNVPPEFAKSTTLTVNYVTWRIVQDPATRVIIVSETQRMAKKFLKAIKDRLTHPSFRDMWTQFGPPEGFQATADSWTQTEIYLQADESTGEKDPTVQALGIGGQIYGARADLIVLDDVTSLKSAHQFEDQIEWTMQDALTRLSDEGKLMVVGTRVGPLDLYSEMRKLLADEIVYLSQPALLEQGDSLDEWVTLWPERWPAAKLAKRKRLIEATSPRTWAIVYQQLDVQAEAIFPAEKVMATTGARGSGPLVDGAPGHRRGGMHGLYIVAGVDPATVGHTAAVVLGVDKNLKKRYLLDAYNKANSTPAQIRELFYSWTERYRVQEWRVERNAFQRFLTQDEQLRAWLHDHGSVLKEHYTHGQNKWDADYGVQSLETLFADALEGRGLIELPSPNKHPVTGQLVEQLIAWHPETSGKTDLVMALWFAEIRAREICNQGNAFKHHVTNAFMSRGSRKRQRVVNLEQLAQQRYAEQLAGVDLD